MKYSRVTYEERYTISTLCQMGLKVPEIANILKFHKSTIYRELKRNNIFQSFARGITTYDPLKAQRKAIVRKKRCRKKLKIAPEIEREITACLKKRWSPELIAGRLRREKKVRVTFQTIYRFIKRNPFYKQYLLHGNRRRLKYKRNGPPTPRPIGWKGIEQTSQGCKNRSRLGHWERDTMIGKDRKNNLLVCVDRKSRLTKLSLLENFTLSEVSQKTLSLIKASNKKCLSMTNDNGIEFRCHQRLPFQVYYCHPYTPQERERWKILLG